jgi:two-component system, NarL family, sensor histidine kinase UhpB
MVPRPPPFWFRFKLSDTERPEAAYFWRHNMTIDAWLNDQKLINGGRFTDPVTRNWNRPYLVILPAQSWRVSDNYLYVRLTMYPGWGVLVPPSIGSWDELEPLYNWRYFLQISANQMTAVLTIFMALLAFMIWAVDRTSSLYAIFGAACLFFAPFPFNNFLQNLPMNTELWWKLEHAGIDCYSVALILFVHRFLKIERPGIEILVVIFGVGSALMYMFAPLEDVPFLGSIFHTLSIGFGCPYMTYLSVQRIREQRSLESLGLLLCMTTLFVLAVHDLLLNYQILPEIWQSTTFLSPISAPLFLVTMFLILTTRFVGSIRMELDTEQQVALERERIFSDIHDDIGSRLLSLVYSAMTEAQESQARDVLREMRSIVSGALRSNLRMEALVQRYSAETQQRCDKADIELQWESHINSQVDISETLRYHFQRILRELVSNSIKHAHTRKLDISLTIDVTSLVLKVRDYGETGFPGDTGNVSGTGLVSMLRRAKELGGAISWESANPGCSANLRIPM